MEINSSLAPKSWRGDLAPPSRRWGPKSHPSSHPSPPPRVLFYTALARWGGSDWLNPFWGRGSNSFQMRVFIPLPWVKLKMPAPQGQVLGILEAGPGPRGVARCSPVPQEAALVTMGCSDS